MRITVSHTKSKLEIIRVVDQSFEDLFKGVGFVPLRITNEKRSWQGDVMTFSFDAKMGVLGSPIKGTVEVTEKDLTIDADLGLLERLLPAKQAKAALEGGIKGLLR